ncbi:MAG: phenylalanine--tRNA ligase subunit beta [Gemmataceae bacterium]
MKVPLSWLRDYVDLDDDIAGLIERLTLAGLEVTGVRLIGVPPPPGLRLHALERGPVWDRDKVFVAEVVEVHKHPNADRLHLVTVAYGDQIKTVVTGAPNLHVGDRGQKVVLALAGAVLFDGHAQGNVLRELKPAKIRGVLSEGMVCSARELGLGEDHEGILLLDDDAPVGVPLADYLGDIVLDVDVLPNMARCLSLIGIAREVAALTGRPVRLPVWEELEAGPPAETQVHVEIHVPELCRRYLARLISDVRVAAAPMWMQRRLLSAGMRPICNVVDITNYVLLEWGQPLHAFDYDRLVERAGGKTPQICVRLARAGETLRTLDGVERQLAPEHLVIADVLGPIALAGVMGGADTEVTPSTRRVLLEAAHFDPVSIRRTARHFDLPSESSLRFSRGVHPEIVAPASSCAIHLMRRWAGGVVARGTVDQYPAPLPQQVILLPLAEVERLLGLRLSVDEIERLLQSLAFVVHRLDAATLQVTVPPHRLDIQEGVSDLCEEIARIYGYDRIPATLLADVLPDQQGNLDLTLEDKVRDRLVACGLQEVVTYALTTPEKEAPFVPSPLPYVQLANPISAERTVMRQSVVASVLDVLVRNARYENNLRFFEIGKVYLQRPEATFPEEKRRLALAMTGRRFDPFWADPKDLPELDFFDLKGIVEALAADLHVPPLQFRPASFSWLHPGQAAEIRCADTSLGWLGQLHPVWQQRLELPHPVWILELDLEDLLSLVPARFPFEPLSEYPPVKLDLALVVDETVCQSRLVEAIRAAGGTWLRSVELFDVYRGPSIPAGKKSLAYTLTFQAPDRTLTDEEVARIQAHIVATLEGTVGARLRGPDSPAQGQAH